MFSKAIFVDFKKDGIDKSYFERINRLFKKVEFIKPDDPSLYTKLRDVEVVFVQIFTKVDKQFIDAAPKLKYVGVQSTAYDAKYARSKHIVVCNLGGYSTEAVAEFFFAILLESGRELEKVKQQAKKADFSFNKFMGLELKGKTLGLLGAGRIGSRMAEIGLGFGMKVIYFSRTKKPKIEKLGAKKRQLDDVLAQADIVSMIMSLNKETKGIMSKKKISLLKPGAVLISLAPPSLIDQEAIIEAANKGKVTFMFDHSDDISASLAKRFLKTKNCIVYPPTAFRTHEANTARIETFVSNIEQFAKNKPQNVVN